jgi:hypothetical protein
MFELWDLESGNAIASFRSRDRALAAVREFVATQGAESAASLVLGFEDESGRSTEVAQGEALLALAGAAAPGPRAS